MPNISSPLPALMGNQYQAPNVLGMAQNAASLIGKVNANKAFAAQSAQSKIYANSLNSDGSLDASKYTNAVAASPVASSYGAQEAYNQAQEVNNKLIAGTGMSLQQHITRLSTAANSLQALNASNNGQGITAPQFKDAIITELNNGLINAKEAASLYTDVSNDPKQNAQTVRNLYAGVTNNLHALMPVYGALNTGAGTITTQSNPNAAGGAVVPNVQAGLAPGQSAQPVTYVNSNNQTVNTTLGRYNAAQGINTSPQIGGGVSGASTNPQLTNQPPLPVIGGQSGVSPLAAVTQQPVVAGTHGPIMGPVPGLPEVQKNSESMYTDDQTAATGLAPRISALQELAASAPGAQTGPASGNLAQLRALGQEFGLNVGTDQASQEQVMSKATNMLVTNGLSGLGQPTDAKMLEVIGATPNSKMTPAAVSATVAMTYGSLLYQQNLAKAAQNWIQNQGGSPANYAQFKLAYQQHAPSPLVLSLPYMPPKELLAIGRYIKTLPPQDQKQINSQIEIMNQMNQSASNGGS